MEFLTGFESTNAAVLVEPERVRLFIDHPEGVDLALCERVTAEELDRMPKGRSFQNGRPSGISQMRFMARANAPT